jgi:integrase
MARSEALERLRQDAARERTFDECASEYIAAHEAEWENAKHRQQWRNTLATYASPIFGEQPVQAIDVHLVQKALQQEVKGSDGRKGPLWTMKPETAKRVRGRIEAILDWATAKELRTGDNPARWTGLLSNLLPKRAKGRGVAHHAALAIDDVGGFIRDLRAREADAALAFEFLILTAARTSEVLSAKWAEIDETEKVWTIPAARMKARKEHRVPLSASALAVLAKMVKQASPSGFIFPGMRRGKPLSNMVLLALLRRMGHDDVTAHGFRSTFRDWVSERTNFPDAVAEAALAHANGDRVEAAYRRGDLFEKRRQMMEAWARHCDSPKKRADVVPLPRRWVA